MKTADDRTFEVVFESRRISFVKVTEDLLPEYLEMVNDVENVLRYIGGRLTPYTEEEERDYIRERIDSNALMFSMLEKKSGRFIGNVEFFERKKDGAELGIAVTTKMQNKGYGTEATLRFLEYGFKTAGFKKIRLNVYVNNPRAVHVYENCGFREVKRDEKDISMEITRDVFEAVERISEMEKKLDRVSRVLKADGSKEMDLKRVQKAVRELERYYTGPEWKSDLALDEKGLLPKGLKRGVLSEDGISDILDLNKERLS